MGSVCQKSIAREAGGEGSAAIVKLFFILLLWPTCMHRLADFIRIFCLVFYFFLIKTKLTYY